MQKFIFGFIAKQLGVRLNPFHSRRVVGLLTGLAASATYFATNANAIRQKFREVCLTLDTPPQWADAVEGVVPGAAALIALGGFVLAAVAAVDDTIIRKQV